MRRVLVEVFEIIIIPVLVFIVVLALALSLHLIGYSPGAR